MKGERIWVHPEVIEEAHAAYEWYRARSPAVAEEFMNELDRGMERILERPRQWAPYVAGTRRHALHRFPFLIVFREVDQSVQILAVAHARRRPGYWRDR